MRWGKGPKQRLRFTKTGDPTLEEAYATHFVWLGKVSFHERAAEEPGHLGITRAHQVPIGEIALLHLR